MSAFDSKGKTKYPDEPYQIFAKTEEEIEMENRKRNAELRSALDSMKKRWDAKKAAENKNTPQVGGENT